MTAWCGCCGGQAHARKGDPDPVWCKPCMLHVAATGPLWERTYEALNGEPCPYQLSRHRRFPTAPPDKEGT